MTVPFLIARRYLRPRRLTAVSVIGIISVVGIVIGTAALVIVMSLFNGFRNIANDMMISFGPHLTISPNGSPASSPNGSPVRQSKLILQHSRRTGVVQAVGVQREDDPILRGLKRSTFVGRFHLAPFEGVESLVISTGVAESLQLFVGDTVQLMAPEQIERALSTMSMPTSKKAVVRAVFQSNAARDIDQYRVYTSYDLVSVLTGDDRPTSYDMMIDDPRQAQEVAEELQAQLGSSFIVRTWEDLNRGLVDTMKLERIGSFIVLALIVVVAAFNVLVSLTLGVVERRRDIAILQTIGLTPRDIRTIYVIQGLVYGVVSVVIGIIIGLAVCYGQQTFHWIRFDMSAGFLVPALPLEVHAADVIVVAVVGMLLASVAAVYPAKRAVEMGICENVRM